MYRTVEICICSKSVRVLSCITLSVVYLLKNFCMYFRVFKYTIHDITKFFNTHDT